MVADGEGQTNSDPQAQSEQNVPTRVLWKTTTRQSDAQEDGTNLAIEGTSNDQPELSSGCDQRKAREDRQS